MEKTAYFDCIRENKDKKITHHLSSQHHHKYLLP